ncbi:hypothetical protein M8C21_020928 [Ambrosia artemisiifolia]|nr:hypothetical protein M8C21_020928 [Ambrosia artemisiifolia]
MKMYYIQVAVVHAPEILVPSPPPSEERWVTVVNGSGRDEDMQSRKEDARRWEEGSPREGGITSFVPIGGDYGPQVDVRSGGVHRKKRHHFVHVGRLLGGCSGKSAPIAGDTMNGEKATGAPKSKSPTLWVRMLINVRVCDGGGDTQCNPSWPEIRDNLATGQQPQDRPDLLSRVFRAKLEELKDLVLKKHILGEVKSHVYVIEFQKRGLPHAHFLLIMHPQHKINSPDQYDKFVCAEIPNKQTHPTLHDVVINHMIHGPCGALRPTSPCMEGTPKICRFRYPRQFNEQTIQGEDAYPLYRRRDNGITAMVRGKTLDNRWVVPYNPKLLMMFNCHINLEICSSIKSVKYLFKYIYKGHDKQVIQIDEDNQHTIMNEIKRFQDARYISPPEAMWRIFKFPLSQIQPAVLALQLHLPNNHSVTFTENAVMTEILNTERNKKTMLTAFFEENRLHETARQYLYKDFPAHYTWSKSSRSWGERSTRPQRGRIVSANPAEGERYYLRILLTHIRGPTSFKHLRTVGRVTHPTFRKAALEHGLIENDNSLSQCLDEASLFQFPNALRRLFATILVFCEPADVRKLWVEHFDTLSEDYRRQCQQQNHIQNMVLQEIRSYLHPMGKRLADFDLPTISNEVNVLDLIDRDTQEELSILVDPPTMKQEPKNPPTMKQGPKNTSTMKQEPKNTATMKLEPKNTAAVTKDPKPLTPSSTPNTITESTNTNDDTTFTGINAPPTDEDNKHTDSIMIKLFKVKEKQRELAENSNGKPPVKKQSAGELRLHKDISELNLPKTCSISFPNGKDDLMNFEVTIRPDDGYYLGGTFTFTFQISSIYPHEAPKVKCKTKVYHPNIDLDGNVCLNILREDWKPVLNINTIIYGLYHLFTEPNHEDPLNREAAAVLRDNPKMFESNVRRAMAGGYVGQTFFTRCI